MPDLLVILWAAAFFVGVAAFFLAASMGADRSYVVRGPERERLRSIISSQQQAVGTRLYERLVKENGQSVANLLYAQETRSPNTALGRRHVALDWLESRLFWAPSSTLAESVRCIDVSPTDGALYSARQGANVVNFLVVTCPTKGDHHVMLLPRRFETAREARAWTFGVTENEFETGAET